MKYSFYNKVAIDTDEYGDIYYYSYYIRDLSGREYLVPIDVPIKQFVDQEGVSYQSVEDMIRNALKSHMNRDFSLDMMETSYQGTYVLWVKRDKQRSVPTECCIVLQDLQGTYDKLSDENCSKLNNIGEFVDIIDNDINREKLFELISGNYMPEISNPLLSWLKDHDNNEKSSSYEEEEEGDD